MKNPLPFGLTMLGAFAMVVATFLPLYESHRFLRIADNAMIQNADGWLLIALAVGIVISAYYADQGRQKYRISSRVLPAAAMGCLLLIWSDKTDRTLYPIGPDGAVDNITPGEVADLSTGFYLAIVGVALAAAGSWMLWMSTKVPSTD